jgi:hypothetical protein
MNYQGFFMFKVIRFPHSQYFKNIIVVSPKSQYIIQKYLQKTRQRTMKQYLEPFTILFLFVDITPSVFYPF